MVGSESEVLRSLLLMTPIVLAVPFFFRQGRWLAAMGSLFLTYAIVVAVAFNVFNRSYGIGVFTSRME
jgi:hypothetical protein